MNVVILLGRLTADPELKQTPQGTSVATFTVAVDRGYVKQGEERQADFIRCVAWRNTADFISKWFKKGQMIAVEGNLRTRTYDDKDGKRQYITEININGAHFAGGNSSATNTAVPEQASVSPDGFTVITDDGDMIF